MGDGGGAGDPGQPRPETRARSWARCSGSTSTAGPAHKAYGIPASNPYVGQAGQERDLQRGLRNPWRFSFDRSNGNLWIGDVGQDRYEEIDRATEPATRSGNNWGWRVMEGYQCYRPSSGLRQVAARSSRSLVYSHASNGRCAVTGGYVYRGSNIPALRGWYVFGDYCSGEIWAMSATASDHASKILLRNSSASISSFGEGAGGELYVVDLGGTISRIDHG